MILTWDSRLAKRTSTRAESCRRIWTQSGTKNLRFRWKMFSRLCRLRPGIMTLVSLMTSWVPLTSISPSCLLIRKSTNLAYGIKPRILYALQASLSPRIHRNGKIDSSCSLDRSKSLRVAKLVGKYSCETPQIHYEVHLALSSMMPSTFRPSYPWKKTLVNQRS